MHHILQEMCVFYLDIPKHRMVSLAKLKTQCQRYELYSPPNSEVKSPNQIIEAISQHKHSIEGFSVSPTNNFPNENNYL